MHKSNKPGTISLKPRNRTERDTMTTRTITGNLARDAQHETGPGWERTTLILHEPTGTYRAGEWTPDPAPTEHIVYASHELARRAAGLRQGDALVVTGREYTLRWTDRETLDTHTRRVIDAEHIAQHLYTKGQPDRIRRREEPWPTDGTTRATAEIRSYIDTLEPENIGRIHTALTDAADTLRQRATQTAGTAAETHTLEAQALDELAARIFAGRNLRLDAEHPDDL